MQFICEVSCGKCTCRKDKLRASKLVDEGQFQIWAFNRRLLHGGASRFGGSPNTVLTILRILKKSSNRISCSGNRFQNARADIKAPSPVRFLRLECQLAKPTGLNLRWLTDCKQARVGREERATIHS